MNIAWIHKTNKSLSRITESIAYLREYTNIDESELSSGGVVTFSQDADVVVLDVTSTGGDAVDKTLIEIIKSISSKVPILLATNNQEKALYREMMLDAGVDACIQMPFLDEELYLRINKLVNKKETLLFNGTTLKASDVSINLRDHRVSSKGKIISLTKTEYSILFHLFIHKNKLVTNKELSSCVDDSEGNTSHALNTHIFNLRKKIHDSTIIKTVPLYGFTVSDSCLAH